MWVAIVLACANPTVFSCSVMIKNQSFYTEQECIDDSIAFGESLLKKGIIAIPSCHKIKTGVSL